MSHGQLKVVICHLIECAFQNFLSKESDRVGDFQSGQFGKTVANSILHSQVNEILNVAQLSLDDIPQAQCAVAKCGEGEEPLIPDRDDLNQRFAEIEDKLNELLGVANLQCKF